VGGDRDLALRVAETARTTASESRKRKQDVAPRSAASASRNPLPLLGAPLLHRAPTGHSFIMSFSLALPHSRLVCCAALLALLPASATAQKIPPTLTVDSTSAAALSRRQPRERPDTIRAFPTRKLADGVYAVLGDTGRGSEGRSNAGFVVTRTGVVVIDALASPAQGKTLLRTIRTVTPLPVQWLILTHHHPDHTFGAIVFKRAGAKVLAHPDRRTLASEDGDDAMVSAWTGVLGLREMQGFAFADTPDVPIAHDTTVTLGGRTFVIDVPGTAHTPGDLVIWLPGARVLFAGDLLIEDGVAMVVDGSSGGLLTALDRLEALKPLEVMPGHGRIPAEPLALIHLTRCETLALRAKMRDDVQQGVSMSRALASLPPADRDRPVSRNSRVRRNAVRIFAEMEQELLHSTQASSAKSDSVAMVSCAR
jgi:glyoxylase-like metal-dependent hydrolase (beta-lactamase superfamily II)